jgi:SnoaL-like polyketide cyclase
MAAAENKMLIRRLLEDVWWRGDLDLADKLLAANFVRHGPALERETRGAESYRDLVTLFRSALPDLHGDIEAQIAEGDTVVSRWTAQGTHRGEMLGRSDRQNRHDCGVHYGPCNGEQGRRRVGEL